ncbi:hypothetical protein BRAS3843_240013 [Bradyrhizobium sp. STM 3843]|nr:hypothetical protein BRAS3843_240013 [Bradyrhizobium sp. STM 3843]
MGAEGFDKPPVSRLETALLAGRFGPRRVSRPVVRPFTSLGVGPVGDLRFSGTQEGAFPQTQTT